MLQTAKNVAGSLEVGLEQGIWQGVKGAMLGYMTLPVIAAVGTALFVGLSGAGFLGLGGGWAATAAAGTALLATSILAYPFNKNLAKLGGMVGGVVGFTSGVDEPEKTPSQSIQLAPDQELVVVNKPQLAAVNTHVELAKTETEPTKTAALTPEETPRTVIKNSEAEILGERVDELVREYTK